MLESNEWVRANPYFTRGAEALAREMVRSGRVMPQFVNFSAGNIEALLPSRFLQAACRFEHAVLIADAHLYPLALCYHREFRGIAGVFKSNTPRAVMMATLRHLRPGDKMALPALPKETGISYKEAFVLEEALSGVPIGLLARYYRRNPKTLYGWRQEIARKLAVRQLNHLLMLPPGHLGVPADGGRGARLAAAAQECLPAAGSGAESGAGHAGLAGREPGGERRAAPDGPARGRAARRNNQ